MADWTSNVYLQSTLTTLGYIVYPIAYLVYGIGVALLFIAKLLYGPLAAFLQPFIFIGRFIFFLILLPYTLIISFEPLYNFLGVGAIVGILIGLGMYYSARKFNDVPDVGSYINRYVERYLPWLSDTRTVKEYREGKARSAGASHLSLPSSGYASLSDTYQPAARGKKGILSQTILEEADSDF